MAELILVVDDEKTFCSTLATVLREEGFETVEAFDGASAMQHVQSAPPDVAICDIRLPDIDGVELLGRIKQVSPATEVIIVTEYGTVDTAVEAMRLGAHDCVMKPFMFDDLIIRIRRLLTQRRLASENAALKRQVSFPRHFQRLVGRSQAMHEVYRLTDTVAATRSNVLLLGESGTGKELVARAIHERRAERDGPFIPIDCAALPETLIESQLFGHLRGSFTGANADMMGLLQAASGGTVFLDEAANTPLSVQAKLLRTCDRKEILPLGAKRPCSVEVRLVAGSNRNLADEVKAGRFREDLFYRLNVMMICLPPLRERKSDIPDLVQHFVAKYNAELGRQCRGVEPEALRAMMRYDWPGNVRELENVVERGIIVISGELITANDLPEAFWPTEGRQPFSGDLRTALRQFERDRIIRALRSVDGNREIAASLPGIGLSSLYRKIDEFSIQLEEYKGPSG